MLVIGFITTAVSGGLNLGPTRALFPTHQFIDEHTRLDRSRVDLVFWALTIGRSREKPTENSMPRTLEQGRA